MTTGTIGVAAFGERKSFKAWAADPRCAVSWSGLRDRILRGWEPERAITEPSTTVGPGNGPILLSAFGETRSLLAWSADPRCAVSRTMLRKRLAAGMPAERALSKGPSWQPTFGTREAFGEHKTIAEWSRDERCRVSYATLQLRLTQGWEVERALAERASEMTINGVTKGRVQWHDDAPVSPPTIRQRLRDGWDLEAAYTQPVEPKVTRWLTAWGETKRLCDWMRDPRCKVGEHATVLSRLRAEVPVEVALTMPVRSQSSFLEQMVAEYVETHLGLEVIRRDRRLIHPKELDIVVPSRAVAVEFNGIRWHQEWNVGKLYHAEKWRAVQAVGLVLIQVWEDDWINRQPIVKRMLAAKLGRSDERRVHARSTAVGFEDSVDDFLEANHIQGRATGTTFNIGLRSDGELVAVVSFQRRSKWGYWLLTRYATSVRVPGGFTKCLGFLRRSVPCKEIRTFSDNCVSDGGLYRQAGFVEGRPLPPDYSYAVDDRRVHKFNYRLARFREDPDLLYEDGKTEAELAAMNDLPRVWDAGKRVWVLSIP